MLAWLEVGRGSQQLLPLWPCSLRGVSGCHSSGSQTERALKKTPNKQNSSKHPAPPPPLPLPLPPLAPSSTHIILNLTLASLGVDYTVPCFSTLTEDPT